MTPDSVHLSRALTVLRGALAGDSGGEDDPWDRVILETPRSAQSREDASPPPFEPPPLSEPEPADARPALLDALAAYAARHGRGPAEVRMGGRTLCVVRDPPDAQRPLRNKVAVVTGAAGAIGAGICAGLLRQGCRVAPTDVVEPNLRRLCEELSVGNEGRVAGVQLDVTDPASVASGIARVAEIWGGVDVVVANAGIAAVASLLDLDPEVFRRLERVNVEGTLHTLAESGRWLRRQGTGGDIVLVSTKNVFAPGASFGAYSATKAASHQLARVASIELAPHGVRVNMVAPDAVFGDAKHRSGLWEAVGPSRMRARGLDEKGLEDYYRGRNLLKARVTAEHVARAVLFFVTRQTPTTGATLPVDGGLPDATPR